MNPEPAPFAPPQNRTPRQGQALVIAVLLMLLAALLSSAFLVMVTTNTQQVGREFDKDDARENSIEGANQAKNYLKIAVDSDHWAPENVPALLGNRDDEITPAELPPDGGDANYDLYWSQFDQTMGWALPKDWRYSTRSDAAQMISDLATLKATGQAIYIKFPDPLTDRSDDKVPHFMLESRLLNRSADEITDGGDKKFMLRVTAIGRLTRNETSWAKTTVYKTTNFNGGTLSYANFVSNYYFDQLNPSNSQFARCKLDPNNPASVVGAGFLQLNLDTSAPIAPPLLELGKTVVLSNGKDAPVFGIIAASLTNQVTLRIISAAGSLSDYTSATLSLAGNLVSGLSNGTFDADGNSDYASSVSHSNSLLNPIQDAVDPTLSDTDSKPFGNGTFYNLGLTIPERGLWAGRAPYSRSWAGFSTVSGQNFLTVTGPVDGVQNLAVQSAVAPTPLPTLAPIEARNNRFLRVGFTPENARITETYLADVDPLVAPRPVQPASLDFAAYAQKAWGNVDVTRGKNGYGPGVYIDNAGDVEKFGATLRVMSNAELERLWQRKSFPVRPGEIGNITYEGKNQAIAAGTTGARLSFPRLDATPKDSYVYPMTSGTISLEQRAIRGWISPWEFLPRGAQVILNGSTLTIVRDPLSDGNPALPDPDKSWKNESGVPMRGAYTLALDAVSGARDLGNAAFPQPMSAEAFNGLIVAEGNLRVRGTWNGPQALTIVAKGNIYIEGSVRAAPGKIALLSKKNVTLNPTEFANRPLGLVDRAVALGNSTVVGSSSIGSFSSGQVIAGNQIALSSGDSARYSLSDAIFVGGDARLHIVQSIAGNTLTVGDTTLAVAPVTVKVQQLCDPQLVAVRDTTLGISDLAGPAPTPLPNRTYTWNYAFRRGGETLCRQLLTSGTLAVGLKHAAELVPVKFGPDASRTGVEAVLKLKKGSTATGKILATIVPTPTAPPTDKIVSGRIRKTADGTSLNVVNALDLRALTGATGDDNSTLELLKARLEATPTPAPGATPEPKFWTVTLPTPTPAPAPGPTSTPGPNPYTRVPARYLASYNDSGAELQPSLTTSLGVIFAPKSATDEGGLDFAPFSLGNTLLRASIGSWFGYQPSSGASDASQFDGDEDAVTTKNSFYGSNPKTFVLLDSTSPKSLYSAANASPNGTIFSLTRPGFKPYHDYLPIYFLGGWHFENGQLPANGAITPVLNIEVQATIYAEQGAWFVIPMPATRRATALSNVADAARFRRPFYRISVEGNIAQAFTPTASLDYDDEPDPDDRAWGASKSWLDSLALPTQTSGSTPINWQVIEYRAAPLPLDHQLILPTSNDVLYTSTS